MYDWLSGKFHLRMVQNKCGHKCSDLFTKTLYVQIFPCKIKNDYNGDVTHCHGN